MPLRPVRLSEVVAENFEDMERLLNLPVLGPNGERVGVVRDVVHRGGRITRVVVRNDDHFSFVVDAERLLLKDGVLFLLDTERAKREICIALLALMSSEDDVDGLSVASEHLLNALRALGVAVTEEKVGNEKGVPQSPREPPSDGA